ncbi:mycothiol synthase [Sanguibacter antarcticus]|uniref:Mycothiol acetyltransferase n=1 Tax=Sanguibacter antarcticus TaxID=372484 RepID=A0A2A9E9E0_9MICO|nr:mycothiol synthase [Sanguibacter antarcticus]PFG35141.1 mycothiol synthase [Sanguibacter antarcticus]
MDDAAIDLVVGPLEQADAEAVLRLARAAEHVDGTAPVSEQPLLWLTDPHAPVQHLLVRAADDLAGYAQVDLGSPAVASAELVVHPFARCHGVGTALVARAESVARAHGLELRPWAHGHLPAAQRLAQRAGYGVVRELLRMTLDLRARTPEPVDLPAGVTLRTFRPGSDDEAWLAVNARAFADHPEQGRMTLGDLQARRRETWFDEASFLLAVRDEEIVGFCWLKVLPAGEQQAGESVGEIYAVGVDPAAQGTGLGTVLTRAGLDRLQALGLETADLYTGRENTIAVRTYERAGFVVASTDVQLGPVG